MCVGNKLSGKGANFLEFKGVLKRIVFPDDTKARTTNTMPSIVKNYQSTAFKTMKQRMCTANVKLQTSLKWYRNTQF